MHDIKIFTRRNTGMMIVLVWILAFVVPSPYLTPLGHVLVMRGPNGEIIPDWTKFMIVWDSAVSGIISFTVFSLYLVVVGFIRTNRLETAWTAPHSNDVSKI